MTREIENENENTRGGAEQSRSREKRDTQHSGFVSISLSHDNMNYGTSSGVIKDKEKAII